MIQLSAIKNLINACRTYEQIESDHPEWITSDSPTQRVAGVAQERFEKVKHPSSILSLANAFSDEDVISWYDRISKLNSDVSK